MNPITVESLQRINASVDRPIAQRVLIGGSFTPADSNSPSRPKAQSREPFFALRRAKDKGTPSGKASIRRREGISLEEKGV